MIEMFKGIAMNRFINDILTGVAHATFCFGAPNSRMEFYSEVNIAIARTQGKWTGDEVGLELVEREMEKRLNRVVVGMRLYLLSTLAVFGLLF